MHVCRTLETLVEALVDQIPIADPALVMLKGGIEFVMSKVAKQRRHGSRAAARDAAGSGVAYFAAGTAALVKVENGQTNLRRLLF